MSGVARIMRARGWAVSGSDRQDVPDLENLRKLGVSIHIGHAIALLDALVGAGADVRVVHSVAVPPDDPELCFARERGWEILSYPQMLGRWSRNRFTIAIAGTHGKTTTCAMAVTMLRAAGLDPGFVIGGRIRGLEEGNAHWGCDRHPLVIEACEFADSFLQLAPDLAVVTNVEADHLDYHGDLAGVCRSFRSFLRLCGGPSGGVILTPQAIRMLELDPRELCWLAALEDEEHGGVDGDHLALASAIELCGGTHRFQPLLGARRLPPVRLAVPGRHNVANALTALAAVAAAGVDPPRAAAALAEFRGAERRFDVLLDDGEQVVIDDYAHHPTEIAATLQAARDRFPDRMLVAIFQPHQASRTRQHLEEFGRVLAEADHCLLSEIYFARDCEEDRRHMSAQSVAQEIRKNGGQAEFHPGFDQVMRRALELEHRRIAYLVMGAGDVFRVAQGLVRELQRNRRS